MSELLEEVCAYMQVSGRVPLRFIPALVARLAELEAKCVELDAMCCASLKRAVRAETALDKPQKQTT